MTRESHSYRASAGGRGLVHDANRRLRAQVKCACGSFEQIGCAGRTPMPPDQLDKAFRARGWKLDPATCPGCVAKHKESRKMANGPTPGAINAQAKMFTLLHAHFDADAGTYGGGYSDAKIAAETGLALDLVRGVREQALGPLKEPPEIAAIAADIAALQDLLEETVAPIKTELEKLRGRVAEVRRRFAQ